MRRKHKMGIGDRTSSTTDFFATHKAQCVDYAAKLQGLSGADALITALNASASACDAPLAGSRRRTSMASVVDDMPALVSSFAALPRATRDAFHQRIRDDAAAQAEPGEEAVKPG